MNNEIFFNLHNFPVPDHCSKKVIISTDYKRIFLRDFPENFREHILK
jgi:hypothetical protein